MSNSPGENLFGNEDNTAKVKKEIKKKMDNEKDLQKKIFDNDDIVITENDNYNYEQVKICYKDEKFLDQFETDIISPLLTTLVLTKPNILQIL